MLWPGLSPSQLLATHEYAWGAIYWMEKWYCPSRTRWMLHLIEDCKHESSRCNSEIDCTKVSINFRNALSKYFPILKYITYINMRSAQLPGTAILDSQLIAYTWILTIWYTISVIIRSIYRVQWIRKWKWYNWEQYHWTEFLQYSHKKWIALGEWQY